MPRSYTVDEISLPRYVNWSSNFKDLLSKMEIAPYRPTNI